MRPARSGGHPRGGPWLPAGRQMAAYGEYLLAADTRACADD